jgi:hypothetical protein
MADQDQSHMVKKNISHSMDMEAMLVETTEINK